MRNMNYRIRILYIGLVKSTLKMTAFEAMPADKRLSIWLQKYSIRKTSTPEAAWVTILKIWIIRILKQRKQVPAMPIMHLRK